LYPPGALTAPIPRTNRSPAKNSPGFSIAHYQFWTGAIPENNEFSFFFFPGPFWSLFWSLPICRLYLVQRNQTSRRIPMKNVTRDLYLAAADSSKVRLVVFVLTLVMFVIAAGAPEASIGAVR